jgi:hypothetical protein
MNRECTTTLKLIHLKYSGRELEAALLSWRDFPTLKGDCKSERSIKKSLREARMQKYLSKLPQDAH